MLSYTNIRIHTSEKARYQGKALASAVVHQVHSMRLAARCAVYRAREGFFETGERASDSIADLSYNLPLLIDILVPSSEAERLLDLLKSMVQDGAVCVLPVSFLSFRSGRHLLPPHLKVKDVMTRPVVLAHPDFTVRSVIETLLDQHLKAIPVADAAGPPLGIVTQQDLTKAGMPVRLGLFTQLAEPDRAAYLKVAESVPVTRIMTKSPVVIQEDSQVSEAVHLMVARQKKRLPVVDRQGRIVGILSRIDLLKAVSTERSAPVPADETREIPAARTIREIAKQDSEPLLETLDLQSAIDQMVKRGEQRAAVVDREGRLLGVVTDRDIFQVLVSEGWGQSLRRLFSPSKHRQTLVGDLMQRGAVTITQGSTTDEALQLMVEKGLKRIPVVDDTGHFQGMVRRDALLITLSHDM